MKPEVPLKTDNKAGSHFDQPESGAASENTELTSLRIQSQDACGCGCHHHGGHDHHHEPGHVCNH